MKQKFLIWLMAFSAMLGGCIAPEGCHCNGWSFTLDFSILKPVAEACAWLGGFVILSIPWVIGLLVIVALLKYIFR